MSSYAHPAKTGPNATQTAPRQAAPQLPAGVRLPPPPAAAPSRQRQPGTGLARPHEFDYLRSGPAPGLGVGRQKSISRLKAIKVPQHTSLRSRPAIVWGGISEYTDMPTDTMNNQNNNIVHSPLNRAPISGTTAICAAAITNARTASPAVWRKPTSVAASTWRSTQTTRAATIHALSLRRGLLIC